MISNAFNMDCMLAMKDFPDKYFELAIVDPPYGIGWTDSINYSEKQKGHQLSKGYKIHLTKEWDNNKPDSFYFKELFRVSQNQIIFGGNYFTDMLPVSKGWLIWDKDGDNFTAINNEMAWTSFNCKIKTFRRCHGLDKGFMNKDGGHIHPTQKPVKLYKWLLKNYAKEGDKILDTHLGSGSSRIACYDYGFDFWGYELDKDYFEAQEKRFKNHVSQEKLFA